MTKNNKITRKGLNRELRKLRKIFKKIFPPTVSRDTIWRHENLETIGGALACKKISRHKPCYKNRVDESIEQAIVNLAFEKPSYGQEKVSAELKTLGIPVSAGGVRSVWLRYDLETFQKRLMALKAKADQENMTLTEDQLRALERVNKYSSEIETLCPGYLGFQDTYYVGESKTVGRIFQQTFIDSYSMLTFVKLYDRKDASVAVDFLRNRVVNCYKNNGIHLLRVMTNRGTQYYGNKDTHEYLIYLNDEDIHHLRTKEHSWAKILCNSFHHAIQNDFYTYAFRRKSYRDLEELQKDADCWLADYNKKRPYSGKYCFGKTPWQTFMDGKKLAVR